MKNFTKKNLLGLISLFNIVINNNASSQWIQQVSNVYNVLNSVHCTNDTVCYTVGDYGERLKTINGGLVWENLKWFGDNDLKSVFAKKDTVAFATGLFFGITAFLPGLEIWGGPYLPFSTENLLGRCLYYINNNYGFAVGDSGVIIESDTGLVNTDYWFLQNSGTTRNLYSVHFSSDSVGYVAGDSGTVLKTINGGNNWVQKNLSSFINLKSVFFINDTVGFVAGVNGSIFKTTDGGDNWLQKSSNTAFNLNSVCFPSDNVGYIAGDNGIILKTTDEGDTWGIQQTGVTNNLKSVYFTNDIIGYAVGSYGKILKTTNGGGLITDIKNIYNTDECKINIFPNPFNYFTTLKIETTNGFQKELFFQMFDIIGQEVKRIENIKTNEITIKRDNLTNGIYFYKLRNGEKILKIGKIIIE